MRNETLLKIVIAAFAIILIILATFVYGNIQRSKQKAQTPSNQNTVQSPQSTTQTEQNKDQQNKSNSSTTNNQSGSSSTSAQSQNTAVAPSTTPSTSQQNGSTPNTGASDGVVPATIIATLGYIYLKSRKQNPINHKRQV